MMIANEHDQAFYQRELASFLPERVYDAHCHLWPEPGTTFRIPQCEPMAVGYEKYLAFMDDLHPGRQPPALFLSFANVDNPGERDSVNDWIARQTKASAHNRGLFFVRPEDDPEWVRDEVRKLGLHGLKCYFWFAQVESYWEAEIPDYLPEQLVKVAEDEGWAITVHLVRSRAVADPSNLHWIRRYCESYPNMKMILAHSARGFQPAHNLEGLPQLAGLDNLYFDTSANCEPMAHQSVIRVFGHQRLMYGTDFPVSHYRGVNFGAADSFLWVYDDAPVWNENQGRVEPVLIGLEHLRAIKWACWSERLGDSAVEDIFWNNAARVLGVPNDA